ncbi:hypothetical protein JZ751_016987 [Albula glossodonta]|uniref:Uncharacterized protein n=1 Tax=Albula glossodonta TaxID=121402 RepID=A0A8T2MKJ9_9TELE|nr:hypothetical protein JZ751_016987 [Albula glossodonta]
MWLDETGCGFGGRKGKEETYGLELGRGGGGISFVGGLKLGFHLHQQSSEVEGKQWRMFFGGGCQLQKNPR